MVCGARELVDADGTTRIICTRIDCTERSGYPDFPAPDLEDVYGEAHLLYGPWLNPSRRQRRSIRQILRMIRGTCANQ